MRNANSSSWWAPAGLVASMCLLAAGALAHSGDLTARPAQVKAQQSSESKQTQAPQSDPWTAAQTVDPATLAKEISGPANSRPTVVSVSPHIIYATGHIPGAVFQGPGNSAEGIEGLKRWAQHLPRSTNLVLYCGCCPLVHCPNLRPAFRALQSMGFTHLRALILTTNFYTDWYSKGYPTEKGS
jgi:3-mercaptopyruvate sulfurtransferase SseA